MFIMRVAWPGALESPKGRTKNSNLPNCVLSAVFGISASATRIMFEYVGD